MAKKTTTSGPTIPVDERLKRGQDNLQLRVSTPFSHRLKKYCDKHGHKYGAFVEEHMDKKLDELEEQDRLVEINKHIISES